MDERDSAIDMLNNADLDQIRRLEYDPRMGCLGLSSGLLAYSRSPRCEVRRVLLDEAKHSPEAAEYWTALGQRVKVLHQAGAYCPDGICPDDPHRTDR